MQVYWIVWITMLLLSYACSAFDYPGSENLTSSRVKHSNITKAFFIVASVTLILIAGSRYNVGSDFNAYYQKYYIYLNLEESLKNLEEPGIRLIYNIAILIKDSGGMCIMVVAAVTLGLQLSTIYKNTDNIGLALFLFTITCWYYCFNGVRQALAAAVLFCGLPALRDRKFIKYAITVFLAFLCHRSAIVMIFIYFTINRKVSLPNIVFLIVMSVIVLFSYDQVFTLMNLLLDNNIVGTEEYWGDPVNILRILTEVAPAVLFLLIYAKREKTEKENFYLNLLIVHAVVGVSTAGSACFGRMALYTMPFAILSIVELLKVFPKGNRKIYGIGIAFLYLVMQYYELAKSPDLSPFHFKWYL